VTRLVMPDSACRQVDVESAGGRRTGRYTTGRDGTFEVTNPLHERRLRELGAFPASGGGIRTSGYPCGCGFLSLFVRCSKCGMTNPRAAAAVTV